MLRRIATLVLPLLLLLPAGAQALRVEFSGIIVELDDPFSAAQPGVFEGVSFRGAFELDPADAFEIIGFAGPTGTFVFPTDPNDPLGPGSTLTGFIEVGGTRVPLGPRGEMGPAIHVLDDFNEREPGGADRYVLSYFPEPGSSTFFDLGVFPLGAPGLLQEGCRIDLADSTGTAHPGGFYVPGNLSGFDSAQMLCEASATSIFTGGASLASFRGEFLTWTVTPEPGSLILGIVGCVAFVVRRRFGDVSPRR